MRGRKGVDLYGRGGREELRGVEEGKIVIRIFFLNSVESVFFLNYLFLLRFFSVLHNNPNSPSLTHSHRDEKKIRR